MPRSISTISTVVLLTLGACASPTLDIPAPWESVEGPGAEVPTPNLQPTPPGWSRAGLSVRGKQIEAVTVGEGAFRVYVIGGIAGDEPEGPQAAGGLRAEFFKSIPDTMTVRIIRDMNPDGSAVRTRANTRGVDLTRNWASSDYIADRKHGSGPASELETTTITKDFAEFKPNLVVIFRSSARGPMVSMDGSGPLLAGAFGGAARDIDPRWRALPERRTTEAGSPESFIAGNLKKPVLTVEFQRGRDAATNAAAAKAGIIAAAAKAAGPSANPVASPAPVASAKKP